MRDNPRPRYVSPRLPNLRQVLRGREGAKGKAGGQEKKDEGKILMPERHTMYVSILSYSDFCLHIHEVFVRADEGVSSATSAYNLELQNSYLQYISFSKDFFSHGPSCPKAGEDTLNVKKIYIP